MLSLVELSRAVRVLEDRLRGHRVQAIVQPDDASVVLTTYGPADDPQRRKHHRHTHTTMHNPSPIRRNRH